jgi:hypothetical protein
MFIAGLKKTKRRLADTLLILLAACALSACIQSKAPLLSNTKPLLGDDFQLQLYEEFVGDKAKTVQTSVFRWTGDRYALVSGKAEGITELVAAPAAGSDVLVQASDGKIYAYLLARRIADGTFRIIAVDQDHVDEAVRKANCVTLDSAICMVATQAQLDLFVRASAAQPVNYTMVAVISAAPGH